MRTTTIILSTLATLTLSAPTPDAYKTLPLNLLSLIPKYLSNPPPGACDVSKLSLPSSALPAPDTGLTLVSVLYGRGTQNYTCASSTSTDKPVAAGALANLFDANCLASHTSNEMVTKYGQAKSQLPKDQASQLPLPLVGEHFFSSLTTPVFATSKPGTGVTSLKKLNATAAADAKNVPWLKLGSIPESTSSVRNVYRVNTVAGQPPVDCAGQERTFQVQYAADYWFYAATA